jgi:hypothetical protein
MNDAVQTTPNGVVLTATLPDGSVVNVTEHVSAIYDLVIGSMDFGSGFLTVEDAVPLAGASDEAERYLRNERHRVEAEEYLSERVRLGDSLPAQWHSRDSFPEHEHAWSSQGLCMWRGCPAERDVS